MSIQNTRKRNDRLILIPMISGRHFLGCSWGEDEIPWSIRPLALSVPLSPITLHFENHYPCFPRTSNLTIPTNNKPLQIYARNGACSLARGCWAGCIQSGWKRESTGPGCGLWRPYPIFRLTEENWAWGRLNPHWVCVPWPWNSWVTLYLFFAADVSGGSSPSDRRNGVSWGFTSECDLLLQFHGSLVLYISDFGFCWKDKTFL